MNAHLSGVVLTILTLMPLISLPGADFHPANAELQQAVEKGLQVVAQRASAGPTEVFTPVAFFRVGGDSPRKGEWVEELVPMPSATVVPNFPQEALKKLKTKLTALQEQNLIESYFIIHEIENKVNVIIREGKEPEKVFIAPFNSRDEIKKLKTSDLKSK